MASPTLAPAPAPAPTRSRSRSRSHEQRTQVPTRRPAASRGARTSPASRVATRAPRVTTQSTVPPIRLTRRGRLAAFAASLAALAVIVVGAGHIADASASEQSAQHSVVVVQAGDTLWGIAKEIAPNTDRRAVVHQIRQLNDLGTRSLQAGQSIVVPSSG